MLLKVRPVHAQTAVARWTDNELILRGKNVPPEGSLTIQVLEGIFEGISAEVGRKEAVSFVQLLSKLENCSVTDFAAAFEQFWQAGCKIPSLLRAGNGDEMEIKVRKVFLANHGQALRTW